MEKAIAAKQKKQSQVGEIWRRLKKSKTSVIGMIVFLFFVFLAIFGTVLIPYSESIDLNMKQRLQAPSSEYIFGTDEFGRNLFARCVHSCRVSITIALVSGLLSTVIGTALGAIASYFGKWVDTLVMRLLDVLTAIPMLLMSLVIVSVFGADIQNLILALVVTNIPSYARIARSTMIGLSGEQYVEAAHAYGASHARVMFRYIVPNAIGPVLVQFTMGLASGLLAIASLSYLGLGLKPPTPDWGGLLNAGKPFMTQAPYLITFPGLCIVVASLAINLFGDGLRDTLDPKLKT